MLYANSGRNCRLSLSLSLARTVAHRRASPVKLPVIHRWPFLRASCRSRCVERTSARKVSTVRFLSPGSVANCPVLNRIKAGVNARLSEDSLRCPKARETPRSSRSASRKTITRANWNVQLSFNRLVTALEKCNRNLYLIAKPPRHNSRRRSASHR